MRIPKNNLREQAFNHAVKSYPNAPRALCFGDSWFQYLPHPTDLNSELARTFRSTLFLDEGVAGRDSAMWTRALARIRTAIASYQFNAILLSTGGNDIVGEEMKHFLKTPSTQQTMGTANWGDIPQEVFDHVRLSTLQRALEWILTDIDDVVQIRNLYSPSSILYVHTYDYVYPSGKSLRIGPIKSGPWIKPHMDKYAELHDPIKQRVITTWLLDQFAKHLRAYIQRSAGQPIVLVNSLGTLTKEAQWQDEIHPTRAGFQLIAKSCWKPLLTAVLR